MITEILATQQTERQTVTINTAAYDVRISASVSGGPFLRQCRIIAAMGNYGFRYFQARDNVVLRSLLVQVPAPISIASQGIPLSMAWVDSAGNPFLIPEIAESNGLQKYVPVPFENSEMVVNTPLSFPASCSLPAGIITYIIQTAETDHVDCRFHMTGLNAAYNGKVIPITVYARIEHTLPMITD